MEGAGARRRGGGAQLQRSGRAAGVARVVGARRPRHRDATVAALPLGAASAKPVIRGLTVCGYPASRSRRGGVPRIARDACAPWPLTAERAAMKLAAPRQRMSPTRSSSGSVACLALALAAAPRRAAHLDAARSPARPAPFAWALAARGCARPAAARIRLGVTVAAIVLLFFAVSHLQRTRGRNRAALPDGGIEAARDAIAAATCT